MLAFSQVCFTIPKMENENYKARTPDINTCVIFILPFNLHEQSFKVLFFSFFLKFFFSHLLQFDLKESISSSPLHQTINRQRKQTTTKCQDCLNQKPVFFNQLAVTSMLEPVCFSQLPLNYCTVIFIVKNLKLCYRIHSTASPNRSKNSN